MEFWQPHLKTVVPNLSGFGDLCVCGGGMVPREQLVHTCWPAASTAQF